MYTPTTMIVEILIKTKGKALFDYLVSRTQMKRTDVDRYVRQMEKEGIVKREGDQVILLRDES